MRRGALNLAVFGLTIGLAAGIACGEDDCQSGTEGCSCHEGSCFEGLRCLSGRCVDPDWRPPADDSGDGGDDDGDDSSPDNVGACENWIDATECGDYDFTQVVDCSIYSTISCDIADYFDCLSENTPCADGVPDITGWMTCVALAECG